jgi:hypothetical protein
MGRISEKNSKAGRHIKFFVRQPKKIHLPVSISRRCVSVSCSLSTVCAFTFFKPALMTSAKAIQIAKEIDSARCKGNWNALPELARRYKKHNPDGTGKLSLFSPITLDVGPYS